MVPAAPLTLALTLALPSPLPPRLSIDMADVSLGIDFAEAGDVNAEADRTLQMLEVSATGAVTLLHPNAWGQMCREGAAGFPWRRPLILQWLPL
jgi:hypothetical protein